MEMNHNTSYFHNPPKLVGLQKNFPWSEISCQLPFHSPPIFSEVAGLFCEMIPTYVHKNHLPALSKRNPEIFWRLQIPY